ncbi:MAG: hypothetical protein ABJA93_12470 [Sporichthyaceae bacterium]
MSENTSEQSAREVAVAQREAEAAELARRKAASRRPGEGEALALPENDEGVV